MIVEPEVYRTVRELVIEVAEAPWVDEPLPRDEVLAEFLREAL